MKWLGMLAAVLTLAAVVLNSIWFGRHGNIPFWELVRLSGPTVLYLLLFLGAVFCIGWLSARVLARVDPRDTSGGAPGEGGGAGGDGAGRGGDSGDGDRG